MIGLLLAATALRVAAAALMPDQTAQVVDSLTDRILGQHIR